MSPASYTSPPPGPQHPEADRPFGEPVVNPLPAMELHEKSNLRAAAFRATRVYPGPVGELISRELLVWENFGFRLNRDNLIMNLVRHVMTTPTATEESAA